MPDFIKCLRDIKESTPHISGGWFACFEIKYGVYMKNKFYLGLTFEIT